MTVQNERGTARLPIEEPMTEEARGVYDRHLVDDDARVWLSDEFSVAGRTLCLHRPLSPNGDFMCLRAMGHAGRHEHHVDVRITPALSQPRGDQ